MIVMMISIVVIVMMMAGGEIGPRRDEGFCGPGSSQGRLSAHGAHGREHIRRLEGHGRAWAAGAIQLRLQLQLQ